MINSDKSGFSSWDYLVDDIPRFYQSFPFSVEVNAVSGACFVGDSGRS